MVLLLEKRCEHGEDHIKLRRVNFKLNREAMKVSKFLLSEEKMEELHHCFFAHITMTRIFLLGMPFEGAIKN